MQMTTALYPYMLAQKSSGARSFAVLIDPDKITPAHLPQLAERAVAAGVDYFFVGGSLVVSANLDDTILSLKQHCHLPVFLFPGSPAQLSHHADALLYLSLISGRNADLLIGQHVVSAPAVKRSGVAVISTGYMVVDGGAPTTVSYMSSTPPLPHDKPDIAVCTAMAGEMLGMKLLYLDAGSGAKKPVSEAMIKAVSSAVEIPLIVGGGMRTPEAVYRACKAGADVVVVGNALEETPALLAEMAAAVKATAVSV